MGIFQKFVELGTDAKYVKLGRKCDICARKLGFFETGFWSSNAKQYSDGVLCKHCDEKIELLLNYTPVWVKAELLEEPPYNSDTPKMRFSLQISSAKLLIDSAEAFGKEELAALGPDHTSIFRAESTCTICPKNSEVGIKRATLLKDKSVVYGFVQLGQFRKGDSVLVQQNKKSIPTTILEAYVFDCEENTLDIELKAHSGKQCLSQWQIGWLVLDTSEVISARVSVIGRAAVKQQD